MRRENTSIVSNHSNFLEMISSSPQLLPFSLCACFLVLHSFKFPPSVCGSFTELASFSTGNETDRQALLAFKNGITSDPFGALNSWNHSVHFCQWYGVTCGRLHRQRVTRLDLDHLKLEGFITPHIGNLSFLRELFLRNNSLGQRIPPEFGRLQRLQIFSLWNNSVGGVIPVNISRCSNLFVLELSGNNLEGEIPADFGMLSKLEELYMGWNYKIAGAIPTSMANLSALRVFDVSGNIIDQSIPYQLGRLKNLEVFGVLFNNLVGTIPRSIWNISSMGAFYGGENHIGGSLPSELGGIIFPRLAILQINKNLFTGAIPVSISNASYLENLDMQSNKLTGDVPPMEKLVRLFRLRLNGNFLGTAGEVHDLSFLSSLTNASELETLSIGGNNFGGDLPSSIGNLSSNSLRVLDLASNKVSGIIPRQVGNLVNLQILDLRNNKLTGKIPSTIASLKKFQALALSDNDLSSTIPLSIGNLSNLLYLYLWGNNLNGTIPSSLGKCTNLLQILVSSNNLQDNIPREIFSASSLLNLDLSGNHLTGNLPIEVGALVHLLELNISVNLLSGKVPSTLASCVQLKNLDMGVNNFSGILPPSLSSLRGLENFNLSHNNISGTVPRYLEVFPFLQHLDLSFNDLEGAVPELGVFKNATAFNVKGNINLCGGILELHLSSCNSEPLQKKLIKVKLIFGLVFGITGAVLFILFLYFCWSKKPSKLPSQRSPWNSILKLSYQSIHEATNGFSTTNVIGVGSFGTVYKGLLHQDQKMVAVKVLNLQHQGASRSFLAECEALRRIRHRNLLKVITACSSIDHQGNDFKALIYEFMPNGSLYDLLHSSERHDEIAPDAKNLDLSQRLEVVIGVATAVEYLHHCCEEPIVHCDLKPSNILLDKDMVAHVGDFGLAKFLQEGTAIQSFDLNQSSTIGLRGSVGYVAPEYGMGNEVSTYGDVYSYGIIVLEIFTGKKPTDHHLFNGCLNLREHVEKALPEQVETVADPRLLLFDKNLDTTRSHTDQDQDSTLGSENIKNCLVSLFRVGIACSQEIPRDRMAINDAIIQLIAIKKALLRTR